MTKISGQFLQITGFDNIRDAIKTGLDEYQKRYGRPAQDIMLHPDHYDTAKEFGLNLAGTQPYITWVSIGEIGVNTIMSEPVKTPVLDTASDQGPQEGTRTSSTIAWYIWEHDEQEHDKGFGNLIVQFHEKECPPGCQGGEDDQCYRQYLYTNVPRHEFERMNEAISLGAYFHDNIKDKYGFINLYEDEEALLGEVGDEEEE